VKTLQDKLSIRGYLKELKQRQIVP